MARDRGYEENSSNGLRRMVAVASVLLVFGGVIALMAFVGYLTDDSSDRAAAEETNRAGDEELYESALITTPPKLSELEAEKIAQLGIEPATYVSLEKFQTGLNCVVTGGQTMQVQINAPPYVYRHDSINGRNVFWRKIAVTFDGIDDKTVYAEDLGLVPYSDGRWNLHTRTYTGSCPIR